jgi:hypothetical protein
MGSYSAPMVFWAITSMDTFTRSKPLDLHLKLSSINLAIGIPSQVKTFLWKIFRIKAGFDGCYLRGMKKQFIHSAGRKSGEINSISVHYMTLLLSAQNQLMKMI